jgi:hypothetical protein
MGFIKSGGAKSLPANLQICNSCNRVNRGDGVWFSLGKTEIPPGTRVAYGFCIDCCTRHYLTLPEIKHLLADKTR